MLSMPSMSKLSLLFAAALASIAGAASLQNRAALTLTYGTCDWLTAHQDVAVCRLGDGNELMCDYGSVCYITLLCIPRTDTWAYHMRVRTVSGR